MSAAAPGPAAEARSPAPAARKRRLAVLDDYEHAALASANWSAIADAVEIVVFDDHVADEARLADRLADFDAVFLMRERTPFTASLIARLPKLGLIVTSGMRNASIDIAAAAARGIVVAGTPILAYPAAEHAWALLLALAKRVTGDDARVRAGGWSDALNAGLAGKTLGIVGLGRLGARVARVGLAFEMNVVAWSPNLTAERCAECGVALMSKDGLLAAADFVSIHLVLGERTRGLIGAAELARMKPTACLINTSRGPIVDEAALIGALAEGRIAGAGLDVFDAEPLAADHPLRRSPRTVLTPHKGYVTDENFRLFFEGAVVGVRAWLDGAPINVLGA